MRTGFSAYFGRHVAASFYGESVPFGYWVVSAQTRAVVAVLGVSLNQKGRHLAVDADCRSRAGKPVELRRRAAVSLAVLCCGDFCEHG